MCGRGVTRMFTCMLCGATVCGSDFNQNVGLCKSCGEKAKRPRFERLV